MDARQMTLDEATRRKLAAGGRELLAICDETGNVVGYYLTPDRMATIEDERKASYDWAGTLATEEELDAAERRGGRHTMDEVMKLLERS